MKHSDTLLRDLDHYQEKFEWMSLEVNRIKVKGKIVDEKVTTRLQRNEKKLQQARKDYDDFAGNLCLVLEEVTVKGWQNLQPILLKLINFDMTIARDEDSLLSNLTPVAKSLKRIADEFGIEQSQVVHLDILVKLSALQSSSSKTTGQLESNDSKRILQSADQNARAFIQNRMKSGRHGNTTADIPKATLVEW